MISKNPCFGHILNMCHCEKEIIMKQIVVAFVLVILFVDHAIAEHVHGTSVNLNPPPGFVKSERFPGFQNETNGCSIMVTELPGPYSEVAKGFSDQEKMQARGMVLLEKSSVTVDGQAGMLLHIEQSAYGMLFRKWILVVDRSGSTTFIAGTCPMTESSQQESLLKEAVLSTTFGKQVDPMDALSFSVHPQAPFEIAKVMGNNVLLSPNGQFPAKDENIPIMIVGISYAENLNIENRKQFARDRIKKTPTVKNIIIQQCTPATIGLLTGYSVIAEAKSKKTSKPMTIYQVLLFDATGYCIIQGLTPSAKEEEYLPIFNEIAKSFRLKSDG